MNDDTDILNALSAHFHKYSLSQGLDIGLQVGQPGKDFKAPNRELGLPFYILDWQPLPPINIAIQEVREKGIFIINIFNPEKYYYNGLNILVDKVIDHFWDRQTNRGECLERNGLSVIIGKGDGSITSKPYGDAPIANKGYFRRRVLIHYYCDVRLRKEA